MYPAYVDILYVANKFQGSVFERATSLLGNSFQRVQGMRRTRGANFKYMCYFSAFLVAFILLAYLLIGKVLWR